MNLMDEESMLKIQLEHLKAEHRALDGEIARISGSGLDTFSLKRLKKQKLQLKDRIVRLEDKLYPDIIA